MPNPDIPLAFQSSPRFAVWLTETDLRFDLTVFLSVLADLTILLSCVKWTLLK